MTAHDFLDFGINQLDDFLSTPLADFLSGYNTMSKFKAECMIFRIYLFWRLWWMGVQLAMYWRSFLKSWHIWSLASTPSTSWCSNSQARSLEHKSFPHVFMAAKVNDLEL